MRRVLERIAAEITQFVDQRDDLTLLVATTNGTAPAFLEVLNPIAESSAAGMFHTFDVPFQDPLSYTDSILKDFQILHQGYREVQAQEGLTVWPEVPAVVVETGLPPVYRLRELMIFSRSVLPQPDFQVAVWIFMPRSIADPIRYGQFFQELLAHSWPRPWCHHLRVMLREDRAQPMFQETLRQSPRVRWYQPPLGTEDYNKGFEEALEDDSLPISERMSAALITAATDFAHGRQAQAMQKYNLLIAYHSAMRESVPLALAWNGVGEVQAKAGDTVRAGRAYEVALAHATDGDSPTPGLLFTITWNLARLRLDEQRYSESADYFELAQHSAANIRSAELKLLAMEWHGVARNAGGEPDKAVELWVAGATVAQGLEMPEQREMMLARLRTHFEQQPQRLREIEAQLTESATASA